MGGLPQTRRRSVHDSRNLSRSPAASLRDRLRRPLTEPACRQVRQQSGLGEGSGQDRARSRRREDLGDRQRNHRLTATVTATAAANGYPQRPATAHNTRTIRANLGYVRPEKQTIEDQRRSAVTVAKTVAKPLNSTRRVDDSGISAQPTTVTDGPGRLAHSYGSEGWGVRSDLQRFRSWRISAAEPYWNAWPSTAPSPTTVELMFRKPLS